MKNVWKIFEFEKFDILVSKTFNQRDQNYVLEFTLCVEVGNTATVSIGFDQLARCESKFNDLTSDQVMEFAQYLIDSLGGNGIFEDGGPDEVEVTILSYMPMD